MPNWRQRTGQQTPPERPDRVQPVPETPAGVYFPYRGVENHGVAQPQTVDPDDYYENQKWDDGDIAKTLEPEPEPDPIPVKIVQDTARERLNWRAIQVRVGAAGNPQKIQVVGRHEKRRSITVRNPSLSQQAFIGEDESVSTYTGFLLEQGQQITLRSTEDIWAVCAEGETTVLHVAYEYAVEL